MDQQSDRTQSVDRLSLTAHHLYKTALDACNKRELPQAHQVYMSPNVCIVFSAMAAEAFINEAIELAAFPQCAGDPPQIKKFAESGVKMISNRIATHQKYRRSHTILSGRRPSKKKGVYSDLELLADLRNLLAHVKPFWDRAAAGTDGGTGTRRIEQVLGEFERKGLLKGKELDWVCRACCWPIADWAVQTASGSAWTFVEIIPPGCFRESMLRAYRATFVKQWPT